MTNGDAEEAVEFVIAKIREAAGDPDGKLSLDDLIEHIALLKSRADGKRWRSPADLVAVPDDAKIFALLDDLDGDPMPMDIKRVRWLRDELAKDQTIRLLGWLPMPDEDCVED